jgi:hypothetical protein
MESDFTTSSIWLLLQQTKNTDRDVCLGQAEATVLFLRTLATPTGPVDDPQEHQRGRTRTVR